MRSSYDVVVVDARDAGVFPGGEVWILDHGDTHRTPTRSSALASTRRVPSTTWGQRWLQLVLHKR